MAACSSSTSCSSASPTRRRGRAAHAQPEAAPPRPRAATLTSPSATPPTSGAERLAGLLGGAALVALHEPRLGKEALTADGWRRLLEYAKELV